MRYLPLFSGIDAPTVAWHPMGWTPVAFAEIEPFPCAVLAHHYPGVPNLGDVTKITEAQIRVLGPIDLVVFGSPCQDLSVAGKREGLKGKRSGLFFDAMRIVRWSRARFALFENVPGLFSSNGGRDFAAVVGEMAGMELDVPVDGWRNAGVALGTYGLVEWSVLDAQFFGVPQRRRRIFALTDFGDWRSRPPILLERESLRGNPAPCRETRQDVAPTISARTKGDGGLGTDFDCDGGLIASTGGVSHCLNAGGMHRIDYETETLIAHSLRAEGFDASEDGTGRGIPLVSSVPQGYRIQSTNGTCETVSCNPAGGMRISPILQPTPILEAGARTGSSRSYIAFDTTQVTSKANRSHPKPGDPCHTLAASADAPAIAGSAVRRLLPVECERLMGLPDGYTDVPIRGKKAADGPRYKALGNSMAVPCLAWVGRRIDAVHRMQLERAA